MQKRAILALEDGSFFYGSSSAQDQITCGELVFNTAMTGYQEVCTDPSYANQMIIFTASHIGNVGVNQQDYESSRIWVKGLVMREMSHFTSNWRAEKDFISFLSEKNIPWIEEVDTRKLTRHLRKTGCQNGCLAIGAVSPVLALQFARNYQKAKGLNLFRVAISNKTYDWPYSESIHSKKPLICVYDFGLKMNILEKLRGLKCRVKVVPGDHSAEEILALRPNGIVLSNGPGDPSVALNLVENVKKLIEARVPLLGICFGHQLIGIAAGGKVIKMKFGHHGVNHSVYDLVRKKVYITSQNHNFAIDKDTLPSILEITHISLFDGSIQGFRLKGHPVVGFQGHPEGSPGPQDISWLFEEFLSQIQFHEKAGSRSLSCL